MSTEQERTYTDESVCLHTNAKDKYVSLDVNLYKNQAVTFFFGVCYPQLESIHLCSEDLFNTDV